MCCADARPIAASSPGGSQPTSNGVSSVHRTPTPAAESIAAAPSSSTAVPAEEAAAAAGGERVESAAVISAATAEAEAASKVAAAKALGEENRIIARAQTIRVRPFTPARV